MEVDAKNPITIYKDEDNCEDKLWRCTPTQNRKLYVTNSTKRSKGWTQQSIPRSQGQIDQMVTNSKPNISTGYRQKYILQKGEEHETQHKEGNCTVKETNNRAIPQNYHIQLTEAGGTQKQNTNTGRGERDDAMKKCINHPSQMRPARKTWRTCI